MTLSIPQHRDPVARAALVACAVALIWAAISSALPPAQAADQPRVVVLVATPTLPAVAPTLAPLLSAPTAQVPTAPPLQPTETPAVVETTPMVVVEPAPTEPPAPEVKPVGERGSDKAGPGERQAPVVRGH